jgi:hypothetical protein
VKLVERSVAGAGNEALPDTGRTSWAEFVCLGIPSIKAADYGNGTGVRGPDAEDRARLAVVSDEVGAHFLVEAVVAALVEKIQVLVGKKLWCGESGFRGHGIATEP